VKSPNAYNDSKKVISIAVRQSWTAPFRTEIALVTTGAAGSGCSFDITDAEISLDDRKPLLCVLDRQAFGPFLKVRVTRVPLITFPVMRFLPFGD